MGFFSNLISSSKTVSLLLLIPLLLFSSLPTTIQKDQGFFSVLISDNGLHFAKDLIVQKAVSSIIPLQLPQIEKHVAVPLIGDVDVVLSDVTINSVDVTRSFVESGETGLVLVVPKATAELSMNWSYLYSSWFVEVSDYGTASVEVQGLSVGVSLGMENYDGALKLSVLDSGCYVKTLIIKLDGGSSWFYQWFVDYFQDLIVSRVEEEITKKIKESVVRLDSVLQSLPRQVPVYDSASMNVTFVENPILTNSSIEFFIDGSFVATEDSIPRFYFDHQGPLDMIVTSNSALKMVEISLHEKIFDSASSVLFNAGYFRWTSDGVEDESYLNTAKWKYIVPKLYKMYPNEAMNLNISLSSPPTITVSDNGINIAIRSDVTVGVLDKDEAIPVLCVSLEISASCSPEMEENKLVGTLELMNFEMSLQWSNVGNLHMHLLQTLVSTILKRIAVPYANVFIRKGFPLPILSGFTLQNAEISFAGSKLVICSDVVYSEQQFGSPTKYVL